MANKLNFKTLFAVVTCEDKWEKHESDELT